MLKGFFCPDGKKVDTATCLSSCRMSNRCCSKSYARLAAEERVWNGKPSCTQLLRGTRESYLRIMEDYWIEPDSAVWSIIGKKSHSRLEEHGSEHSEQGLEFAGITGIPDNYEDGILEDYKTWGSYKVMLILGYEAEKVPLMDESGNIVRYKGGKTPGAIRTRNIWNINHDKAKDERWEINLQLNFYRLALENKGFRVNDLRAEVFVRDGNTSSALSRNIDRSRYYIQIERLDDELVLKYFILKRDELIFHLNEKTMPPMCSEKECWYGRKCNICPVKDRCGGRAIKTEEGEDVYNG